MAAGHHKLNNLCAILDYNKLQQEGQVDSMMNFSPLNEKVDAFHWSVIAVDAYLDKDQAKQNKSLRQHKVVSPKDIPALDVEAILISSSDWEHEIYTELRNQTPSQIEVIKIYSE